MAHDDKPRPSLARELIDLVWKPLLWAVPFALFFGTLYGGSAGSYWSAFRISVVFSYSIRVCITLACWALLPRVRAAQRDRTRDWMPEAAVFTGASLAGSMLAVLVVDRFVAQGFVGGGRTWIVSGLFSLVFTVLIGGLAYARVFYRQALDRAVQIERMRAELAHAEVRVLRAQINPHFLFNTLNAIASLIPDEPRVAEDVVTRLADQFRYALASAERDHQRLGDELAFLRDFLAIERVRVGERLRVVEAVEPGLEHALVPSLLLQPLLENAVRYAVAERAEGGTIRIEARTAGGSLEVVIADDGPGFVPGSPPRGHGVGLESVRERLRLAGPGHAFALHTAPGDGTRVVLTLPLLHAATTTR